MEMLECKTYTPRVDGFQIQDVTYIGEKPKNKIEYAIVKWEQTAPEKVFDVVAGQHKVRTEYCYTVAELRYNGEYFVFSSCGMRWLECELAGEITKDVIQMILDFSELRERRLRDERG